MLVKGVSKIVSSENGSFQLLMEGFKILWMELKEDYYYLNNFTILYPEAKGGINNNVGEGL